MFWCEKPCEQTNRQIQQKTSTTSEIRHNKKNQSANSHEHSLSDKVKDMAHSARKLFHHHEQHAPDQTQKPTSKCSTGAAHGGVRTETKKKKTKKTEGQEGHCMPKMLDHVKNLKKKKNKEEKYSDSSDSDDEITKTKN